MPYVPRTKFLDLPFAYAPVYFVMDTTPTNRALGSVTLPTNIVGNIVGFYLEIIAGAVIDTSGASNYLAGNQLIKYDVDSAGTYDDTIQTLYGDSFYLEANQRRGYTRFVGSYVLMSGRTQTFTWGSAVALRWASSVSQGDDLEIDDLQAILHLIVRL